jgi:hypothetical protein
VTGGDAAPSEGDDPSTLELSDVVVDASGDGEVPTLTDGGGKGGPPAGDGPDLAAAADVLGITQQELMAALGEPPPDFQAAAETLGITMQELQAAPPTN